MNEELKPCPFCAGEAGIAHNAIRTTIDGRRITGTCVYCTICNAQMFYRSNKLAIESWNRRAKE